MLQPQKFIQAFVEEHDLFPKQIREEIEKTGNTFRTQIKTTEEKRIEQRYTALKKDKEERNKLKDYFRPLGPRHRVLGSNREKFRMLMEEVQPLKIKELFYSRQ